MFNCNCIQKYNWVCGFDTLWQPKYMYGVQFLFFQIVIIFGPAPPHRPPSSRTHSAWSKKFVLTRHNAKVGPQVLISQTHAYIPHAHSYALWTTHVNCYTAIQEEMNQSITNSVLNRPAYFFARFLGFSTKSSNRVLKLCNYMSAIASSIWNCSDTPV